MKRNDSPVKPLGLVTASPTEYLVHQRLGKTRYLGRGRAAWVMPGLDRAFLIPSSAQTVAFHADQITAENQGIEVSGFAIWSITDPERAIEAVDFADPPAALARIGEQLREVVEAAIRREVANLSLEAALRQRGSMTDSLQAELGGVAERWGLAIASVEIKSVHILSTHLFENMQAKFRDTMRLESARSALEADEGIAREEAAAREESARRELAFRLADLARQEEARREEIARDRRLEEARAEMERDLALAALDRELAMVRGREARKREALDSERGLIELDETLELRRQESERLRTEHRDRIAAVEDAMARREIATANLKDARRLLVEALPTLADGLSIEHLHLGDPALVAGVQSLIRNFSQTQPHA